MRRTVFRLLFSALAAGSALAIACGGGGGSGGGSGSRSSNSSPSAQTGAPTDNKSRIEEVALTTDTNAATKPGEPADSQFGTSFAGPVEVYAMVKLSADAPASSKSAWLVADLKYKGVVVEHNTWAANYGSWSAQTTRIDEACSGGVCTSNLPAGDYDLDVSIAGTTDHNTAKFSVTDRATPTAAGLPKLDQLGFVQNWRSSQQPDASKVFATSFKYTDGTIYGAYKLSGSEPSQGVWVTSSYKLDGKPVGDTGSFIRSRSGSDWSVVSLPTQGKLPAGDLELTLTVLQTGETKTVKAHIDPGTASTAKLDQVAIANQPLPQNATPNPAVFTDKLDGYDTLRAVFHASAAFLTTDWIEATWKYNGAAIKDSSQLAGNVRLQDGWGVFGRTLELTPDKRNSTSLPLPAGDYELVLTLTPSGETASKKFTVAASSITTPTPAPTRAAATATPAR